MTHFSKDAYVLAAILGDRRTTRQKIKHTLATYERIRKPIVDHVVQGSNTNGKMYEFNMGYEKGLDHLSHSISRQWDWLWEHLPEKQVENALEQLYGKTKSRL